MEGMEHRKAKQIYSTSSEKGGYSMHTAMTDLIFFQWSLLSAMLFCTVNNNLHPMHYASVVGIYVEEEFLS
jgi:hypothetical protein